MSDKFFLQPQAMSNQCVYIYTFSMCFWLPKGEIEKPAYHYVKAHLSNILAKLAERECRSVYAYVHMHIAFAKKRDTMDQNPDIVVPPSDEFKLQISRAKCSFLTQRASQPMDAYGLSFWCGKIIAILQDCFNIRKMS